MSGVEWLFPLLFLAALVVSGILAYFQQRRYVAAMNDAAQRSTGPFDTLVTGRGKGLTRGAVVVLVVDRSTGTITYASAMIGATVFASFRPHPELLGNTNEASMRATPKQLATAVEAALAQLPSAPKTDREHILRRARKARAAARTAPGGH